MKNCEQCRFFSIGFYGEGLCQYFGDDLPNWATNESGDGCCLKYQEIKKLIDLKDDITLAPYNFPRDYNGERSEEEKQKVNETIKKYNIYLKKILKKYEESKNGA